MPTPTGISASRGSAILGINKYKSPLVGWLEIMEQLYPGFCATNGYVLEPRRDEWGEPLDPKMASIRWGHAFEDAICDLTGGVTDREKVYSTDKHGFPMTCHLDGLKGERVQENKTAFDMAFRMGWGEPGSDMVPEAYQVQIQQQLYLTGLEWGDFNVLVFPRFPGEWEKMGYKIDFGLGVINCPDGGIEILYSWAAKLRDLGYFHQYHVQSNPATQKKMIENYKLFWNDNILKETPPPVNGYDDIKWLIAAPEGEIQLDTSEKTNPRFKEHLAVQDEWSEFIDIDNEIYSMVDRQKEIKNNFAIWIQKEIQSKNVKPGNEKRKLNIYSGARKLFSITRAYPGLRVSKSTVDTVKENEPEIYELMKKTSFADIMPEELALTEKQFEKILNADKDFESQFNNLDDKIMSLEDFNKGLKDLIEKRTKAVKSLKLTKLLSKDSIMKHLEKHKPEMFKLFYERGIVEMTEPKSTLRINKPERD